jgi:hypothetical protein
MTYHYDYSRQTFEEIQEMQEKEAGRPRPRTCERCGQQYCITYFWRSPQSRKFLGWLCDNCVTAFRRMMRDDPQGLRKAEDQLSKQQPPSVSRDGGKQR